MGMPYSVKWRGPGMLWELDLSAIYKVSITLYIITELIYRRFASIRLRYLWSSVLRLRLGSDEHHSSKQPVFHLLRFAGIIEPVLTQQGNNFRADDGVVPILVQSGEVIAARGEVAMTDLIIFTQQWIV